MIATVSAGGGGRGHVTEARLVSLQDEQARCLDGSRGGYYLTQGAPNTSTTVIMLLEGGGTCTNEPDCTTRANSTIGSSKTWASSVAIDALGDFMSNDCQINPDFCTAWKVLVYSNNFQLN